jgi:hypothetical protein
MPRSTDDERNTIMAKCEDFPCCGHTADDPCDYSGPTSADILADPAKYHLGCDHNAGYCDYEDDNYNEDEDWDEGDEVDDERGMSEARFDLDSLPGVQGYYPY